MVPLALDGEILHSSFKQNQFFVDVKIVCTIYMYLSISDLKEVLISKRLRHGHPQALYLKRSLVNDRVQAQYQHILPCDDANGI